MPKRIPIKALKELAKAQGLTHAILYAYDGELDHIVTWGKTVEDCSQAADFGNSMKEFLGWPESSLRQPARVKKLLKQIKELEEKLAKKRSPFITLNVLDYSGNYAYAPPAYPSLINIEDISFVTSCDARGFGPHSKIKMKNGDCYIVEGSSTEINSSIEEN